MTLVTLERVEKAYGDHVVLDGVGFQVDERDRIGIIGDNGTGKTTLIRILAGEDEPDRGTRQLRRNLRIAYGEQMPTIRAGDRVLPFVLRGNGAFEEMEARVRTVEVELASRPDDEKILRDYGELQAAFEAGGGYDRQHLCEKVLDGLGFGRDQWDADVGVLSGGEISRLLLAVLMTTPADLLIMDEPTNHLDLQGIEFVESFVQRYPGAIAVISHDRRFLDAVTRRIVELEGGGTSEFRGNYSAFVVQRDANLLAEKRLYKKQREKFDKEMEYIRRNMAGRMSAQAKGRLKRLMRMELLDEPTKGRRSMTLRFVGGRGLRGQAMIEAEDVRLVLPNGRVLLDQGNLRLEHGTVIGLLGPNGAGKTTLVLALTGRARIAAGQIKTAHGTRIGFFSQDTSDLPTSGTVLDALRATDPRAEDKELREHLALFLFNGGEVELQVAGLSGGERQRLNLARLTRTTYDLLCLDEPTNHLDITTAESLTRALRAYPGAVLVISHDRQFLEEVTDRVAWLEGGRLQVFGGGLEPCLQTIAKQRSAGREKDRRPASTRPARPAAPSPAKVRNPMMFQKLEERIMEVEAEIARLEEAMTTREVYQDHVRLVSAQESQRDLREDLAALYEQWENWQ